MRSSRYGGWIIAMAVAVIAMAVGFFAGWFSPADTPTPATQVQREVKIGGLTKEVSPDENKVESEALEESEDLQVEDLQAEDLQVEDLQVEDLQVEDLQAEDLQAEDLQAEDLQE